MSFRLTNALPPEFFILQTYDKVKDLDYASDDAVRPWIKGFVNDVGLDVAIDLLEGVGNVSVAPIVSKPSSE